MRGGKKRGEDRERYNCVGSWAVCKENELSENRMDDSQGG